MYSGQNKTEPHTVTSTGATAVVLFQRQTASPISDIKGRSYTRHTRSRHRHDHRQHRGHSHRGLGDDVGFLHGRGHVGFRAHGFRHDWESQSAHAKTHTNTQIGGPPLTVWSGHRRHRSDYADRSAHVVGTVRQRACLGRCRGGISPAPVGAVVIGACVYACEELFPRMIDWTGNSRSLNPPRTLARTLPDATNITQTSLICILAKRLLS